MRRTGFTLFEVALVLTLLVALAALALPALRSLAGPVIFDEAVERVRAELLLARAEAQREGVPVRVWAEPAGGGGGWRLVSRRVPLGESVALDTLSLDPTASVLGSGGAGPGVDDGLPQAGRVLAVLPAGIAVAAFDAGAAALAAEGFAEFDDAPPGQALLPPPDEVPAPPVPEAALPEGEGARTVELAVFLPDGSALETRRFQVVGRDGGRRRLEVSQWSGLPREVEVRALGLDANPELQDAPGQEGEALPPLPGVEPGVEEEAAGAGSGGTRAPGAAGGPAGGAR